LTYNNGILQVIATGTTLTDTTFRIRNSVDSGNLFSVTNSTVSTTWDDNYTLQYGDSNFGLTMRKNGQYGTNLSVNQFGNPAIILSENGLSSSSGKLTLGSLTHGNYPISLAGNGYGSELDHILFSQNQNQTRKASILFRTDYSAGVSYDTGRIQTETEIISSISRSKFNFWLTDGNPGASILKKASLTCTSNFLLGDLQQDITDSNCIYIPNGTSPTSGITNGFKFYSADRGGVDGKASAHFRSEDGTVNVIGDLSGFGTSTPTERLEVSGKTKTTSLQVTSGATSGYVLTSDASGNGTWQPATITTLSSTTATIHFTGNTVFGTYSSPISSNLTDTLTNAKLGVTQKIYHNSGTAPTVPVGWVLLGSTTYQTSTVNIIYAEWSEGTRVEYWIVR